MTTGINHAAEDAGAPADPYRGLWISWVVLGLLGGAGYLEWRRRLAAAAGPPPLPLGSMGGLSGGSASARSLSDMVDAQAGAAAAAPWAPP